MAVCFSFVFVVLVVRNCLADSCVDLQALGTDPMRQREGAGALLMSWAGEKLDEKGVRGMLEASRAAVQYGLYEKYGFRAVDSFTYVDTERFPDAKPISIVTMIRDIKST